MPREPLHEGSDAKQTDLAEIPALLTTGHCYNTVLGSGSTQRCSKGWGLTSRYKAADGQTRCTRQLPGREALLQEPMMIQPSSSQKGCQRHRATGSLWAAGPTRRGPGVCGRAAVGAEAGTGLLHTRAGAETGVSVHPLFSPSSAKAAITAGCYPDHARALSTAH